LSQHTNTADAAGDGEGEPGFGGFLHGFYWRVALTAKMLTLMHITAWETLANTVNVFVADRLAGPDTTAERCDPSADVSCRVPFVPFVPT
jgi:hypothetical protein